MSAPIEQTLPAIEASYKARDVEGILDLRFYRPIGFRLARFFAKFHVTPTQVTFLGACFGVIAGHLYFYQSLILNVAGMILHVISNIFDNADGQLARLTNQRSREGRVIDGVADHFVFASIYAHLTLRYLASGAPPAVALLAIAAALGHAWQACLADYFRSTYLLVIKGKASAQADSSPELRLEYHSLKWIDHPWKKLLAGLYLNFTVQQEIFAPNLYALRRAAAEINATNRFAIGFRKAAQPMLKWWQFTMTNTRMAVLFFFLLVRQPIWYLWLEVTIFNLLVAILLFQQEKMARELLTTSARAGINTLPA